MVNLQREVRIILTERPALETLAEFSDLKKIAGDVARKMWRIDEIDGLHATVLDATLIGRKKIEFVNLSYLTNGILCEKTFPAYYFIE